WQTNLALRVWRAGRCALATTNDVDHDDLVAFARRTVAAAESGMPLPALLAEGPTPPIDLTTPAPYSPEERLELLEQVLAAVSDYPEVQHALVTGCYTE